MRQALVGIIIAIVVYIVSNQLITSLVTGTSTGDTLIQTLNNGTGAPSSNIRMNTGRIRRTLSPLRIWQRRAKFGHLLDKCVETRGSVPYWGNGIVRSYAKV